jgi:hypothetical protein
MKARLGAIFCPQDESKQFGDFKPNTAAPAFESSPTISDYVTSVYWPCLLFLHVFLG